MNAKSRWLALWSGAAKGICSVVAASGFLPGSTHGAEPAVSAGQRAYLYQMEVRTMLIRQGWHVSKDTPGRLVADHRLYPYTPLGSGGSAAMNGEVRTYAWLTVVFYPESVSFTKCTASIREYTAMRSREPFWYGPSPYDNEDSKKRIRKILSNAESSLGKKHSEYAAR